MHGRTRDACTASYGSSVWCVLTLSLTSASVLINIQAVSGMNFSVTVPTPKGLQWLSSANPDPLRVMLPANMVSSIAGHFTLDL